MRCLIIEDDESARELMTRLVTGAGHRAIAVRNGPDGVFALNSEVFDVAIVDLNLPGMDGSATITTLRTVEPHLRVLVVSGYDDRRHVLEAFAAGADGYLVKDEIVESLTASLQQVRAGHSPLSPRVASVVVRAVRPVARRETDRMFAVHEDGSPQRPRAGSPRLGSEGTAPAGDSELKPAATERTQVRKVTLRMADGTQRMRAASPPPEDSEPAERSPAPARKPTGESDDE